MSDFNFKKGTIVYHNDEMVGAMFQVSNGKLAFVPVTTEGKFQEALIAENEYQMRAKLYMQANYVDDEALAS